VLPAAVIASVTGTNYSNPQAVGYNASAVYLGAYDNVIDATYPLYNGAILDDDIQGSITVSFGVNAIKFTGLTLNKCYVFSIFVWAQSQTDNPVNIYMSNESLILSYGNLAAISKFVDFNARFGFVNSTGYSNNANGPLLADQVIISPTSSDVLYTINLNSLYYITADTSTMNVSFTLLGMDGNLNSYANF
jgi:hypothetical protein